MFLRKKLTHAPSKRLKTDIKLDFDFASEDVGSCYNVERKGKGLRTRFRPRDYILKGEATQTLTSNGEWYYFMTKAGLYFSFGPYADVILSKFATDVGSCIFRDGVIVSGKEMGTFYVWEDAPTQIFEGGFSSVTACADRIFGLNGNEVTYCEAGEMDGWSKGYILNLGGTCNALTTVGDKVYALGNTCYQISPDAVDVEFKLSQAATNIGAVSKLSVANYNDRAIFASSVGLYQISSNKITPIFLYLRDHFDMSISAGAWFDGKYYLSCKRRSTSSKVNDITLCLDVDREEVCGVFGEGYESIGASSKMVYAIKDGACIWFAPNTDEARYVKSNIDFGCDSKKFLDSLTIKTVTDLVLTIRSENETRVYSITGKNSEQKIKIRGMGWRFSIEMISSKGLSVEKLQLEAHVCEEV